MTDRPARWRRRVTALVVAAVLGTVGAFAGVAPAQAASTCAVSFKTQWWPTIDGQPRWMVFTTISNTGTAPSVSWLTYLPFRYSSGVTISQYWNTVKRDVAGRYWGPVPWNKIIQPGGSVEFGFEVLAPSTDISPLPTTGRCAINY